ncbi:hypothetical protein BS17DRAFT_763556 [Gyrodon lividus]|nr:hypothetical protein BS17DRAFT_763556 [Gyrodon lividus]
MRKDSNRLSQSIRIRKSGCTEFHLLWCMVEVNATTIPCGVLGVADFFNLESRGSWGSIQQSRGDSSMSFSFLGGGLVAVQIVQEVPDNKYDSPVNGQINRHSSLVRLHKGDNSAGASHADPRPVCSEDGMDEDSFYDDVHVQPVNKPKGQHEDKTHNINTFLDLPCLLNQTMRKRTTL